MGVCEELWSEDLLVRYATGAAAAVVVWSVEAHLAGCPRCRSALSAYVDAGRLARNRSAVLVRVALAPFLLVAPVVVVGAAFVVPGPGWLPVALLLPSLALCAFAAS